MKNKTRFLKQIPVFLMLLSLIACGNANTGKDGVDKDGVAGTETNINTELPPTVTAEELDKAKKEGNPVFLVITGTGATGVEQATAIARDANAKVKNSLVFSLDKDNSANNKLVTQFDIATVPVPFLLVISRKGTAVAGGQPDQMTAEQLIKSIPSFKQDDVYAALDEKRPVFIVVSKKDYSDKENVLSVCKAACLTNKAKPAIVEVDFDDPAEKDFLNQIGVTNMNGSTITAVSNAAGQITGTFPTKPTAVQLNAAANKVLQKSGCAPGGCASSKGCG